MVEVIGGLREIFDALTKEGLGVAGGFVVGAAGGRYVENLVMGKDPAGVQIVVTPADTLTTKVKAWGANNVAKGGLWYLMRRYNAATELTKDASKALLGSIVFDTILRLGNHGVNTATAYVGTYQILGAPGGIGVLGLAEQQKIVQLEQTVKTLQTELQKAMQAAATNIPAPFAGYPQVQAGVMPRPYMSRYWGFMPGAEAAPGTIPPTSPAYVEAQPASEAQIARQNKYGFMQEQGGQAGVSQAAALCGML